MTGVQTCALPICEDYECNDAHIADFEEVLKSATEMVERTRSMMADKVTEGEMSEPIEDADIIEEESAHM